MTELAETAPPGNRRGESPVVAADSDTIIDLTVLERTDVDPHAFASLYIRHRWQFATIARRYLTDQRDVDEVMQEAFLRLFLALPDLDNEQQALAYGRRVVHNLCIDRYRAVRRRPALVSLDYAPELPDDEFADDPVLAAEDAVVVREALSRLSPTYRAVLIKRELEEKPLAVIAAEMGLAESAIKHTLMRARRALRRALEGSPVDPARPIAVPPPAAALSSGLRHLREAPIALIVLVFVIAGAIAVLARDLGSSERRPAELAGALEPGPQVPFPLDAPRGFQPGDGTKGPGGTEPAAGADSPAIPGAADRPGAHRDPETGPGAVVPVIPVPGDPGGAGPDNPGPEPLPFEPGFTVVTASGPRDAYLDSADRASDPETGDRSVSMTVAVPGTEAEMGYLVSTAFAWSSSDPADPTGRVNLVVPSDEGQAGYVLDDASVAVSQPADGFVSATVEGTAVALSGQDDAEPTLPVSVTTVYAADASSPLAQVVTIGDVASPNSEQNSSTTEQNSSSETVAQALTQSVLVRDGSF